MNIYIDRDWLFGYIAQSAFGTAVVASMVELETEPFEFPINPNVLELNRAHQQRYEGEGDTIVDVKGVMHEIPVPASIAKKDELDFFLYAAMQTVSEGAGSPFTKTYTFGQTQPDFSSDAGHFFTAGASSPDASEDWTLADCVVSPLTLSCSPGANNGYLFQQPNIVGRILDTSAAITSFAAPEDGDAADFFNWHDCTQQVDATTLVKGPAGFEIVISPNVVKVGSDASNGYFQNYVITGYTCQYTAQFLYDSDTQAALVQFLAGTAESTLTVEWGSSGSDGHLKFAFNGKYTGFTHQLLREGAFATLVLKCSGTFGGTVPLTVTLSNEVDRGY